MAKHNNIKILRISFIGLILFSSVLLSSCNEDRFLNEVPRDFLSPENALVTMENFDAALIGLYGKTRDNLYLSDLNIVFPSLAWVGTDLVYNFNPLGEDGSRPDWGGSILLPTNDPVVKLLWGIAYSIIYDANVIISRSESEHSELTEVQKLQVQAEAAFFRGYMYKMLANLYGGVPIVLEEIQSPRRDFTRADRNEVYEQAASDLEFAADYLEDIDETPDWRINRLAALHLLSEVYISLERWTDAIEAASRVIDHPNTALMTERFGTMVDHPFLGGDVYWDLFRQGNQNRSTGNTEAIWVLQFEFNVAGGGHETGGGGFGGGPRMERLMIPRLWQIEIPNYDGTRDLLVPAPNTFYYGQGSGVARPSHFFFETLWERSGYDQDIRNSEYNIQRDFQVNNPASDRNGEWILKDEITIRMESFVDTMRNFYPAIAKMSTIGQHPVETYSSDQTVEGSMGLGHNYRYRDTYVIRLAETYLLRAEAHLGNNNPGAAALDINVVRERAKAPDVNPSEVDIEYILDERARELYFESYRLLTLTRLGVLVERARKYNHWGGIMYHDHNNLWPIPFSEIEKNTQGNLEQNPGY